MTTSGLRPYGWMLGGCFWFTGMALVAAALGQQNLVAWPVVAFARSGLATLFALAIATAAGTRFVYLRPRVLWVRSISGSCSMLATFYALTHMPASDVLTVTNTFPMWVALLGWPLTGERPTRGVLVAATTAVVGVGVALEPGDEFHWVPAVAAFFASIFTAVAMLGLNRLRGVASLAVVVHFSAVSTLFSFAAVAAVVFTAGPESAAAGLTDGGVLVRLLAVGATATVGQVCLTRAFATGSATKVAVVSLSQVVMVMAAEAAFGWKEFTPRNLIGTLLVIAPTAWIMARDRKTPARTDAPPVQEAAIE